MFFCKDINILITRVGKNSRAEPHKRLQNFKKENKYENRSDLIISNNKNHVCTKFLLNISILYDFQKFRAPFR